MKPHFCNSLFADCEKQVGVNDRQLWTSKMQHMLEISFCGVLSLT